MRRVASGGITLALVSALAVMGASTGAHAASQAPGATSPQAGVKPTPRPALARASAANLVRSKPAALHASSEDTFVAQPVLTGKNGLQYVPYQRNYRGVPVIGGDFVVMTDANGHVLSTSVAQGKATKLDSLKPQVKASRADAVASRQVAGAKLEKGTRLVVLQKGGSHLAWESTVDGTTKSGAEKGSPSRLTVYTDAHSGKVLDTKEHVADGTGSGTFNGPTPVTFGTTQSGSSYTMKDPNATNLSCQDEGNTPFSQTSNTGWGGGAATDKETACVDALFDADTELKMLSAWDNRTGFDGNGGAWPIHIGDPEENAYYDGTQVQVGYDDNGKWLTPIDVLAHEQGHGVDDHTPGGISNGGTQEFVADTFGASTEWYANEPSGYDTPDFTVGEEVNLGGGPIRYMYDPSKIGDPNCYSSSIPNGEVHASAGPGNHWFYLLAEGNKPTNGQPTSPTCNSSNVTGIGVQKAQQIMYNAMLLKTSSSSYLKYRTWTLTAAKNMYPNDCTEFNAVKAAWDAVSVPAQSGDPTCTGGGGGGGNTVTVTNPGAQTGTVGTAKSVQIVASDSASGQTLTYSASGLPAGESINASSGLISGTPTTAGTYNVTATAKDATGASGSTSFTWTISGGGSGGSCSGQKLSNPGFESGSTGWTAATGVINTDGQYAHAGSGYAWLDGYGSAHTDTLAHSVSIPSGCTATLTYYLWIDSAEGTSTAYDKLKLTANGTTVQSFSNVNKGTGYVKRTVNLSSYAGSTVTLKWTGTEDSSLATSFLIDDTALNLS